MQSADVPHVVGAIACFGSPRIAGGCDEVLAGRGVFLFNRLVQADIQVGIKEALFAFCVGQLCLFDLFQDLLGSHRSGEEFIDGGEWFAVVFLVFQESLPRCLLSLCLML